MTTHGHTNDGEGQGYCPLCRSENREIRKYVRALDWMPMEECRHPWHKIPAADSVSQGDALLDKKVLDNLTETIKQAKIR